MTNLLKEFRELLAKTTQGEWKNKSSRMVTNRILVNNQWLICAYEATNSDMEFIVKAHNDLGKLLSEYDAMEGCLKEENKLSTKLLAERKRYKAALEKCKETLTYIDGPTRDVKHGKATECLKRVQQILDGEEGEG